MVLLAVSTSWFRLFRTKLLAASTKDTGVVIAGGATLGHGGTQVGQPGQAWKSKTSNTSTINPVHVTFPGGQGVEVFFVVGASDVVG